MTYNEMVEERARLAAEWMRAIVAASRLTAETMEALGFTGSPGFMGTGTFGSGSRSAGYERSR